MKSKLRLGFSPCPNDTFIFDALVNGKTDNKGLEFDVHIADVEELNQMAGAGLLDVTKVSFYAYLQLMDLYILLDAGSALGEHCGPLLVTAKAFSTGDLPNLKVAIPGRNTTAHLLLSLLFPAVKDKVEMSFSSIEDAVLSGEADAGLIIHESRFTYAGKGLQMMADLGVLWDERTSTPIPLGGIIAKRNLDAGIRSIINGLIRSSLDFALSKPASSWDFIKRHAQETDDSVIRQHIDLYVTEYTRDLGAKGHASINRLIQEARAAGLC